VKVNWGPDNLAPVIGGRKMEQTIGYLFGHYDSRGGATLVLGCKSVKQAVIEYVEDSFGSVIKDSWYQDQIDWLGEELMAVVNVTYDPKWIGVDVVYCINEGDKDIAHALVWRETDLEEGMVEDSSVIMEIVISEDPPEPPPGFKYALMDFFGEDAFGLIVQSRLHK